MSDVRDVGALTHVWPLRPAKDHRRPPRPPARRPKERDREAPEDHEPPRDGGVDEYI